MKRFTLSNLKQVFELLLGKISEVANAFQSSVDEIYENVDAIGENIDEIEETLENTIQSVDVGTTTTGDAGTSASVENVGTTKNVVLDFTIPKGDKGDQGEPGADGTDGIAATIEVGTVTTGDPGTDASITNSGTENAAIFDFTIPRGDKGEDGSDADVNDVLDMIYNGTASAWLMDENDSVILSDDDTGIILDWDICRTTYEAGTGLSLNNHTFNHSNQITAGIAQSDTTEVLTYNGTFTIPSVTYDEQGHITETDLTTLTMPDAPDTIGTETVGSASRPIYLDEGTPHAITATVGGGARPIYISSGTFTTCSSTVGGVDTPVYMNGGTITACSSTVGGSARPIYMSSGTLTVCNDTIGSGIKPVYMSTGTITASSSTVGSETQLIYMNNGTITASTTTVGSGDTPVYMNNGIITECAQSFGSDVEESDVDNIFTTVSTSSIVDDDNNDDRKIALDIEEPESNNSDNENDNIVDENDNIIE